MIKMEKLADDLWTVASSQTFLGLHIGSRMTVVRMADGGLMLYSPVPISEGLRAEVDALGPVRHILAPNIGHHMHVGGWKDAYPDALLHAATGLAKRRKDLSIDSELRGSETADWGDSLEAHFIEGALLNETAFIHRPSKTLITCDLVENFESSPHLPTRIYLKVGGIHGQPGISRLLRPVFRDKAASRRSIDALLERDIEQISLTHGDLIHARGNDNLRSSYEWLKG